MSVIFSELPAELQDSCFCCMVEERGLQFVLDKDQKVKYRRWLRRSDKYKTEIRTFIKENT